MEKNTKHGSVAKALDHYGEQFLSLFRDESDDDERVLRRMREEKKKKSDVSIGAKEHAGNAIAHTRRKQRMHDVDVIFTTMQGNGCRESSLEQQKIQKNTVDDDEEEERRKQRLEKKRFMASKADRILQSTTVECKRRGNSHAKEKISEREEFKAIAREIQSFGATGLDKKAKARFEQDRLLELGAKKQKGVQISARIGHGMKKKSAQREHRALEEAIASGMVSRKGLASKKRRDVKKLGVDRGLNEDMGSFRNGILRVVSKKKR